MQLTDLIWATVDRIFHPAAPRTAERKVLKIPTHEYVDKPEMSQVLAAAAETLALSGKLWRWQTTDGGFKLCSWDSSQLVFVRGSIQDWQIFIGQHWIVRDTSGREFAGPSPLVADRLIATVLAHPQTPVASWAEQLRRKREATK